MKEKFYKFFAMFLAVVLSISCLPVSVFAATSIPEAMKDNIFLDALEYIGYDVQAQKNAGNLYTRLPWEIPIGDPLLSGIGYSIYGAYGSETVADSSTVTGRAPDLATFRSQKMCCGSYVGYVYFNYLVNIEGRDMSKFVRPSNLRAVDDWVVAAEQWVKDGVAEKIPFTQGSNGYNFKATSGEDIPIGSLIVFGKGSNYSHVAVYAGQCTIGNDTYSYITHVGNDKGPSFSVIEEFMKSSSEKEPVAAVYALKIPPIVKDDGVIEIYKTDENGSPLSGALFVAKNKETGVNYALDATNSDGYTLRRDLPHGEYVVTETRFPNNYQAPSLSSLAGSGGALNESGQPYWTVKIDKSTKTIRIDAVNEVIPGAIQITKTSEDDIVEGVLFTVAGNGVSKTVATNTNGQVTVSNLKPGTYTVTEVVADKYKPQAAQTVVVSTNATATVNFGNQLKRGTVTVTKTSEDNVVSGFKFRLTGTALSGQTINMYATTNEFGVATFNDVLIGSNYTVSEVETPEYYVVPESQTINVEWDAAANTTFNNALKRGNLTVTKSAEDDIIAGAKFHLTGTSESGVEVDLYATTNEEGVATFQDVLIGTGYIIEEVDVNDRYVVPSDQIVDIEWTKTAKCAFDNVLKKFKLTVTKVDSATGSAQGDATLVGATYGIYNGDTLVDTYITNQDGKFTTKYYSCGNEWSVRELEASEGYTLNSEVVHIDAEADKYTSTLNDLAITVTEDVIKGKIAITKHCDDGDNIFDTPEKGATFEVFLKSAGSFDNAKESEKDLLVCGEDGYVESKDLPYGIYTIKQTITWEGKRMIAPFDVIVNEDGKIYRFSLNNPTIKAQVVIQKADAETGELIAVSNIGFKIRNVKTREFIVQQVNYPTPTKIDVFYTDETGKLTLPEAVPYGSYEIIEVKAPSGYVLNSAPTPFVVDGSVDEIYVVITNAPQKGTISIQKTGEVFASVIEKDGMYQPVYQKQGLAGAIFEVVAAKDITTSDGTLRYKKGTVVDTITTGADGVATTKEIYLGEYEVKEIRAPYGMVIDESIHAVELIYADQNTSITTVSTELKNERQKASISLEKGLEEDLLFSVGINKEILSVQFGLYAAEDIVAADGNRIPKGALVEIATCDSDGKITFKTDVPVDSKLYIKEYATDSHYKLSGDVYPVMFEYAGQDEAIVGVQVNDGNVIFNDIIRGTIVGRKVDEDGFAVCGTSFGLFHADEIEFTEETAILTCESNEIGIFYFENVPYGNWIVREIKAAPAFVLNETNYEVTIDEDGQLVEIQVENKFVAGSVQTIKVDKDYPENTLAGAVFEIYVDVDNNKEFDKEIDLLVGEMTECENGIYVYENLRYNGYFLHEKSAPEGFIKDDGYCYFEIRVNGEVVTVENKAGVGFVNQVIKGNVSVTKISSETKNGLSGAIFEIYKDVNGNGEFDESVDVLVTKMTELKDGLHVAEGLRYGDYLVHEKTAPEGFEKDDEYYAFKIQNDGETVIVENESGKGFVNKPTVINPDTGDGSEFGLWITLAGLAIMGMFIIQVKRSKLN